MRESRKWYYVRQICMVIERTTMFVGGIFIGARDFTGGAILLCMSACIHFLEHEGHFRSIRALMGEEVEEHHKVIE